MRFLDGITILDASHVIAGPFATYQLALMGANVIRVEPVGGDDFVRNHGGTKAMRNAGLGASFVSQNAGKTCIQLNLKTEAGVDIFKRLSARADIVMENFRPGVMDRLGLSYAALSADNPRLIYCSLTGFGPDGPIANRPAYDHILQGFCGLMSMTGTVETGPLRVGVPITDYIAGLNAAMAMLAALQQRERTEKGTHLHVSMLASMLSTLGAYAVDQQTSGAERGLVGNRPFSGSPFAGCFETADGHLVITANTLAQSKRLIAVLENEALEPFLAAMEQQKPLSASDRDSVEGLLGDVFARDTAQNWETRLQSADVPAAKVRNMGDVLSEPQSHALGTLHPMEIDEHDRPVCVPGLGFAQMGSAASPLPAPERPGQSTRALLMSLGLSDAEINALAGNGIVAGEGLSV